MEPVPKNLTLDAVTPQLLASPQSRARTLFVVNESAANDARLGPRDVSTARGLLLRAGAALTLDRYKGDLWAIATAGAPAISVLEVETE